MKKKFWSPKVKTILILAVILAVLATIAGGVLRGVDLAVAALDTELAVTADTVAMSTPHEIDYTLTFDSATLAAAE